MPDSNEYSTPKNPTLFPFLLSVMLTAHRHTQAGIRVGKNVLLGLGVLIIV